MEELYLKTIEKYTKGEQGKRGVDHIVKAFATLVESMEETQLDVLGDIYMGAVSRGEKGQFFTPMPVCDLMAEMTTEKTDKPLNVLDSSVGSGGTLIAAGKRIPNGNFVGVDIDHRCVKMTAINLALYGLRGTVVHGDALSLESWSAYEIGRPIRGVIREMSEERRERVLKTVQTALKEKPECPRTLEQHKQQKGKSQQSGEQLVLF